MRFPPAIIVRGVRPPRGDVIRTANGVPFCTDISDEQSLHCQFRNERTWDSTRVHSDFTVVFSWASFLSSSSFSPPQRTGLHGLSAGRIVRRQELRLAPRLRPAHRQQERHRQARDPARSHGQGGRVGLPVWQRHVQPVRPGDAQRRHERGRPGRGNPHAAQHAEPGPG